MLTVVLALVGVLVGVGAVTGTPQALACERAKPDCPPHEPAPTTLTVSGTIVFGTEVVTIEARLRDGQATGRVTVPTTPDQGGPVLDLVARGGNEYCVLIDAPDTVPPSRISYYIRDVGNGLTSLDGYTFYGSTVADFGCADRDPQPADYSTVTAGDITAAAT